MTTRQIGHKALKNKVEIVQIVLASILIDVVITGIFMLPSLDEILQMVGK